MTPEPQLPNSSLPIEITLNILQSNEKIAELEQKLICYLDRLHGITTTHINFDNNKEEAFTVNENFEKIECDLPIIKSQITEETDVREELLPSRIYYREGQKNINLFNDNQLNVEKVNLLLRALNTLRGTLHMLEKLKAVKKLEHDDGNLQKYFKEKYIELSEQVLNPKANIREIKEHEKLFNGEIIHLAANLREFFKLPSKAKKRSHFLDMLRCLSNTLSPAAGIISLLPLPDKKNL